MQHVFCSKWKKLSFDCFLPNRFVDQEACHNLYYTNEKEYELWIIFASNSLFTALKKQFIARSDYIPNV